MARRSSTAPAGARARPRCSPLERPRGDRGPLGLTDAVVLAVSSREELAFLRAAPAEHLGRVRRDSGARAHGGGNAAGGPRRRPGRRLVARREGPRGHPRRGRQVSARVPHRKGPVRARASDLDGPTCASPPAETGWRSSSTRCRATSAARWCSSAPTDRSGSWPRGSPPSAARAGPPSERGLVGATRASGAPHQIHAVSLAGRERLLDELAGVIQALDVSRRGELLGDQISARRRPEPGHAGPPRKRSFPRPTCPPVRPVRRRQRRCSEPTRARAEARLRLYLRKPTARPRSGSAKATARPSHRTGAVLAVLVHAEPEQLIVVPTGPARRARSSLGPSCAIRGRSGTPRADASCSRDSTARTWSASTCRMSRGGHRRR